MKRLLVLIALLLGVSVNAQRVEVQEEVLPNGMRLLIVERHDSPTIAAGWMARVGSVNERPGITGISHLFEHMMFKGTRTIGIKDFEKGMDVQQRQDAVREQMDQEYSILRGRLLRGEIQGSLYDPENTTPRLRELRAEMEKLFADEKQLIVKEELDQIYTREGGSGLNAFTTEDLTGYFVNLPSNKLELWFWLESDRLLNPVFREFYSERDVVREERRLRVESNPTGKLNEAFQSMFWQSSPYSWPVIGWASDVESITRRQAEQFFDVYYAPNNLAAFLVGDLNPSEAVALATRYFGRIPRGETDPPEVITFEVEQVAEKRMVGEADTNPVLRVWYHTPAFNHPDNSALELLVDALSGRTGRLYKALLEERKLVVGQPGANLSTQKFGGYLEIFAEVQEGHTHQEVEDALFTELEKLAQDPLEERELQKLKNNQLADSFRRLQSNQFLLFQLILYEAWGGWSYINEAPSKLQAVTAEEIQAAARKYLRKENRSVARYVRKPGGEQEDPALAAVPPAMKAMVKQQISEIGRETDVQKLSQGLTQVQEMAGQAPEEMKAALEYLALKIRDRIAELSEAGGGN